MQRRFDSPVYLYNKFFCEKSTIFGFEPFLQKDSITDVWQAIIYASKEAREKVW